MKGALCLVLLALLCGCVRQKPPVPALRASPHYQLGSAYEAGGHWYYPAEAYGLDVTGIAAVAGPEPGPERGPESGQGLTADGELRDPGGLAGAMQTIQLPSVVEVTNLENGRQILVRVNDRGPASPARVIAVSPRAALLLAMPAQGAARVRVRLDEAMTRQVIEQAGGGPKLAIATAARAEVSAQDLPPPGSGAQAGPATRLGAQAAEASAALVPDRLPERIRLVPADAGALWLRAGVFGRFSYAHQQAATLARLGGDVLQSRDGRQTSYAVRAGPFRSIGEADAALAEALRLGVVDARITVE